MYIDINISIYLSIYLSEYIYIPIIYIDLYLYTIHVRIDKTTINLQLHVLCFCDHQVNKRSLLQEYSYVVI